MTNIIGDATTRAISDSKMSKNLLTISISAGILNGLAAMIVSSSIDIIVGLMSIICSNEVDMKISLSSLSSRS